jgi:hypothetical protein
MDLLPEHHTNPGADQWEEWRDQQTEVEQQLLTLWQQKHALPFQLERVRALRQSLLWHRQERERIRQQLLVRRLTREVSTTGLSSQASRSCHLIHW